MLRAILAALFILAALTSSGAGRLPRGSYQSSGFNGGTNQANLPDIQSGGDFPFLNVFKTSQGWSRGGGANAPVTPDTLDSDGYPLTTPATTVFTVFNIPDQRDRPGNYVLKWDGNGDMSSSGTVLPTATFTGAITASVLTAGVPSGGSIQKGMLLTGTGISSGTIVGSQLTGSAGQAGTYAVIGTASAGSTSMTVSGGSLTSSTGSGRYVYSTNISQSVSTGIVTVGSPRITNIRVVHVDDEAALDAGEVFSSTFKNKYRQGGVGVIRPLGWGASGGFNMSNVAKWSDRKPTTYAYYAGYQTRSGDYAGSAATLSGQAYTASNTSNGFTLTDKALVHVLYGTSYPATSVSFTNGSANVGWTSHGLSINSRIAFSNDAAGNAGAVPTNFTLGVVYYVVSVPNANTVTLSATQGGSAITAGSAGSGIVMGNPQFTVSIGGSTPKYVLNNYCGPTTDFDGSRPIAGTSQSLATLVYDATFDSFIQYGGSSNFGSMGLENGVPPELQVRLAAEIGAHPWFNIPYLALDPVTDYTPELLTYVKNYPGAGWMVPRVEPINELWNFGRFFFSTYYAQLKAPLLWSGADYMDFYGKVESTIGQTAANIYGGTGGLGTTYQVMLGVQTATGAGGGTSGSNERATASKYVAQAAAAQSLTWRLGTINYTKSAASSWASHVVPANYITPTEYGTGTETTRAAAFAGVRFVASITAGAMTVSQIDTSGGTLAIGKTIFGRGIANGALQSGVTITGGSAPNWTLSSPITLASDTLYAGTDMTQPGLYVDSLGGASAFANLAYVNALYIAWKSWGAGFGINKMAAYEGGYSPDLGSATDAVAILRIASKWSSNLQGYTYGNSPSNYSNFVAAGGEFPSMFIPTSPYPVTNIWSVLNDIYQPATPQWKAVCAFNGTPC